MGNCVDGHVARTLRDCGGRGRLNWRWTSSAAVRTGAASRLRMAETLPVERTNVKNHGQEQIRHMPDVNAAACFGSRLAVLVCCAHHAAFSHRRTYEFPSRRPRCPGSRVPPARTLFLPIALAAAASAAAQRSPSAGGGSSIPTPESVFGFPVGDDYKLFTYDQSIDYFRKLAAASNRVRLITVGKTAYGKTWTAVDHLFAREPRASRQDPRDQHAARAPGGADRRRRRATSRDRGARSSTSAAACTPRRSPGRSTRRRSPTSCCRAPTSRR